MSGAEIWRAVVGFEGLYEVSSEGRVRSVRAGREIAQAVNKETGYAAVCLYRSGKRKTLTVHRAVAGAFCPHSSVNQTVVRHLDGDQRNNHASNLAWGTQSDNEKDAVRHGTHYSHFRDAPECVHGHPFDDENTKFEHGQRRCRACARARTAAYRARKKAGK
jgi:hypothetical protein